MLVSTKLSRLCLSILFFVFVGCGPRRCSSLSDIPPEEQLRSYIDLAVNITRIEQRDELEGLTTGDFKDSLSALSAEAFKESYLDRRYEFDEFEILGQTEVETKKELQIEYRVKFRTWITGEDKTRAPVQEITSIATLKYVQGQWAVASIKPTDTSFNWDVGLPLDGVSTKGVIQDVPELEKTSVEAEGSNAEVEGSNAEAEGSSVEAEGSSTETDSQRQDGKSEGL
ncbi:MAG: hypothetical protein RJB13_1839 [Pseudomonadota bacterium]|jgi:hypothetical protein